MEVVSLARSSTYYVLDDISEAETPDDPDDRINAGELVIVFDGRKYKIGRGVNSLVSFTTEKTEDVRFIKIVEGMDLYMGYSSQLPIIAKVITGLILSSGSTGVHELVAKLRESRVDS